MLEQALPEMYARSQEHYYTSLHLQAKLGVKVVVLDPTPGCPASAVAVQIVGSFRDSAAVNQLAQLVKFPADSNPMPSRMSELCAHVHVVHMKLCVDAVFFMPATQHAVSAQ